MMMRSNCRLYLVSLSAIGLAAGLAMLALTGTARASGGCDAGAGAVWVPPKSRAHRVEAFAHGPNCQKAVATLIIRSPDGTPIWTDAMATAHVMTFADVKTQRSMQAALKEWIRQSGAFKSSGDLPVWKKGADAPEAGEFPFYPEADVDRDSYEKTRAAKAPIFCYVQGMESLSCVVLENDGVSKIGVQSFPG